MKRFVIVGDSHGDMVDPCVLKAFRKFMGMWKPSIRVHLGDLFDLRNLRRGASQEDQNDDLRDDIWNNLDSVVGQLVEVRADAITISQDSEDEYSLRFPRFKTFRGFTPGEKL